MSIYTHELRQGRTAVLLWSAAIAYMLGICIIIYPQMASQMDQISEMFADMGSFSAAFGMDQINFGEFSGYFGIECGNVLGLGGGLFAALLGINALSKEERQGTADFLLSHPISRTRVLLEKLLSIGTKLLILNSIVALVSLGAMLAIGESLPAKAVTMLFLAYLLMEAEIACLTFACSAIFRDGGMGIGISISLGLYFCNILSNLTEELKLLKYLSPYGYTDSSYIFKQESIEEKYLLSGMLLSILAVTGAILYYRKKDII
ncbi:MAG: ABC transporter permease subunit [Oscillospiraceae bacterium]|nr:ABC transporter permease subunit [Oscillospiraceae bacterium]